MVFTLKSTQWQRLLPILWLFLFIISYAEESAQNIIPCIDRVDHIMPIPLRIDTTAQSTNLDRRKSRTFPQ